MHIKKTHGCHPAGQGCSDRTIHRCGAKVTYANLLPNSMIDITVQSPDSSTSGTSAIGHFYMHVDDYGGGHGGGFTFIKDPIFVNGCHCSQCENIPKSYNFQRSFDLPIPPKGTWFDVWISIYWACEMDDTSSIGCSSEDVHYRTYVQ